MITRNAEQQPIDDGFRTAPETVERGVGHVMQQLNRRREDQWAPLRVAAGMALVIVAGLVYSRWSAPEPCVTWACQFEDLSEVEMRGMMDLLEDDGGVAKWSDGDWNDDF